VSLVVNDAQFTKEMKQNNEILGTKKYDRDLRHWKEIVKILTSCQMEQPDGTSLYRYHVMTVTLAQTYKNDIKQILSELNVALRPYKYVLFIIPDDLALVPVELFFQAMPSGKVPTDGYVDIFLQELLDIGDIGLEMVHDTDGHAFLQTTIAFDLEEYIAGVRITLASQGVQNVTVQESCYL
jgi:hypothetical protein